MKRILFVLLSFLVLTGCTFIDVSRLDINDAINEILSSDVDLYNNVFEGYKFYIPRGLKVIDKDKVNLKILSGNNTFYMYVDIVSYYYKKSFDFKPDNSKFLSKKLAYNSKFGYINIEEHPDNYMVEFVYNYSKIEAIISKDDINNEIINMASILSSVQYNDSVIETLIGENVLDYQEEKYDLFESKDENSKFLEALEKYEIYVEDDQKDQDVLQYGEIE